MKRKLRGKGEIDHRRQRLMLNQLELTQGTVASNAIEPNATLHLIVAGGTDEGRIDGQQQQQQVCKHSTHSDVTLPGSFARSDIA